jgi:hypothetical protein
MPSRDVGAVHLSTHRRLTVSNPATASKPLAPYCYAAGPVMLDRAAYMASLASLSRRHANTRRVQLKQPHGFLEE